MTILEEEKPHAVMSDHQKETLADINRIMQMFKVSDCIIRPHFIVTGPSGSGKSHNISAIAKANELNFVEINAAQLTKEGTAGNSLTKAMSCTYSVLFISSFDKFRNFFNNFFFINTIVKIDVVLK